MRLILPNSEYHLIPSQADQGREDIASILDDLAFVKG
jgi:hypothetical protein